ncbi:uncharacterized protein LOC133833960 [Humulus lupulus]|uniref:uncharacterized protein LOC133833960 n=1 Tax=Humulus lupulus TaxID=3486 RepID=UPI002B414044|nr:uncharacterized protein LOC133833960 [Humulus lupulus]
MCSSKDFANSNTILRGYQEPRKQLLAFFKDANSFEALVSNISLLDFRHAVMTPAILLMCEYLMRCPIVSGRDIAFGSFICSMLFSVAKQSKKFCLEAIGFLRMLLMAAKDEKPMSNQDTQERFFCYTLCIL